MKRPAETPGAMILWLASFIGGAYISGMNIRLPPDQQKWLDEQIAKGAFISPDDAVQQMIAERMAFDGDDLAWAKPYVDEGRAAVARGEVMTLEEHRARMVERLKALKP
jgi:antitoxin ParD1/3/4